MRDGQGGKVDPSSEPNLIPGSLHELGHRRRQREREIESEREREREREESEVSYETLEGSGQVCDPVQLELGSQFRPTFDCQIWDGCAIFNPNRHVLGNHYLEMIFPRKRQRLDLDNVDLDWKMAATAS